MEYHKWLKILSHFLKKIGLVTEPIVALKRTIKIKPKQKAIINLVISVGEEKERVIENIKNIK